jgi:hypothetical protein
MNENSLRVKHWSDGLTMYIEKNGIVLKLNEKEIEELVSSLPRTFGRQYNSR